MTIDKHAPMKVRFAFYSITVVLLGIVGLILYAGYPTVAALVGAAVLIWTYRSYKRYQTIMDYIHMHLAMQEFAGEIVQLIESGNAPDEFETDGLIFKRFDSEEEMLEYMKENDFTVKDDEHPNP
jgi:hypothetical protein